MPTTTQGRRNLLATSADEPWLMLLEITHPELNVPVRVVSDTQNITVLGSEFLACPFDLTLPDDVDRQIPRAQLAVDNVGRELTQWLEYSRGGAGARCRIMAVLRSQPDVLEFDMTMDMSEMVITNLQVTSLLGFKNTLGQVAVSVRYDPTSAPGVF